MWLFTSLLFGAMHLVNAALGAPFLSALQQAGVAAMSGTAFYIVRRVTGSLIWAMFLHGIWDVAAFSVGYAYVGVPWGVFLTPFIGILAVAVVYWVIKGADERIDSPAVAPQPAVA